MKKIVSVLIILATLITLTACKSEPSSDAGLTSGDGETTFSESVTEAVTDPVPEGALLLFDGEEFVPTFVRPEKTDADTLSLALALKRRLEELVPGDANIKIKHDYLARDEKPAQYEIVVGNTQREASVKAEEALGNTCAYSYTVNEKGAVIVGTIPAYTRDGIRAFTDAYLSENLVVANGKYYLKQTSVTYVEENPTFCDVAVLCARKNLAFDYTSKHMYNLAALGSHKSAQGACVDSEGKYLYVSMQTSNKSSLAKYELETGKQLEVIANTGTDHSNDMTFNAKEDFMIVVHNAPNYARITTFKNGTMEKLKTVDIVCKMNGLAYCAERDQYAAGISGTWNFWVLDSNFKKVGGMESGVNTEKTRQGLDCDEDYVYFVQSAATGNPGNIIMIYSWQGEFLARVELTHNTQEGETLLHVGNQLYLHCNRGSGGALYKLTPKKPAN